MQFCPNSRLVLPSSIIAMVLGLLVASCGMNNAVDRTKFDALNRAATTIQASTSVGVGLVKFQELVQVLATEYALASQKVTTPAEKELLSRYQTVVEIYRDSLLVWNRDITSHGYSTGVAGLPAERIHVNEELEPVVTRYQLTTELHTQEYSGTQYRSIPKSTIQLLWAKAEAELRAIGSRTTTPS